MTKVPKYRKQKNMAQQMKAILIILMVVLAVYAGVSAMLLGRTRKQAIQEMDEMSKLYTDELTTVSCGSAGACFPISWKRTRDILYWGTILRQWSIRTIL